jgi:outer membrane immunogenic protein
VKNYLMISVAVGALVASAGWAVAADAFDWTGPYLGASIGVVRVNNDSSGLNSWSSSQSGVLGLVDGGYNWQAGKYVYGVEGDVGVTSANGSAVVGSDTDSLSMGWNASLRARAGIATDNALIYVTGGLAAAYLTASNSGWPDDHHAGTRLGATVGVGAEFAVSDKMTLKVEGRYTAFADDALSVGPYVSKENAAIGLVGLNFHF